MSEVKPVHRYKAQTLFSFGSAKIEYFPHGPEVVLATEFDAQRLRADTAEADALIQYAKRVVAVEELSDAKQRIAEQDSLLEEMATEMTLAISDSQIRSAMTVIGRTRFLQILQAHNARIDAALNPNPEAESQ